MVPASPVIVFVSFSSVCVVPCASSRLGVPCVNVYNGHQRRSRTLSVPLGKSCLWHKNEESQHQKWSETSVPRHSREQLPLWGSSQAGLFFVVSGVMSVGFGRGTIAKKSGRCFLTAWAGQDITPVLARTICRGVGGGYVFMQGVHGKFRGSEQVRLLWDPLVTKQQEERAVCCHAQTGHAFGNGRGLSLLRRAHIVLTDCDAWMRSNWT